MNILFLTKTFNFGGVAVVTSVLANKFSQEGHNVSVFVFSKGEKNLVIDKFDPKIKLQVGYGYEYNKVNINLLRSILISQNIDIVINQWGLPYLPIKTLMSAKKDLPIKVISVYHSTPDTNGRLQKIDHQIEKSDKCLIKSVLKLKRILTSAITRVSMKYVYYKSDAYLVLSPSFCNSFIKFTGIKNPQKLRVLTNPITLQNENIIDINNKENEILFVGRIDDNKHLERIIETWSYLVDSHDDWKLTIVGDGPDKLMNEKIVSSRQLKRVSFEGFRNPTSYYRRAKLLMLTSDFEGFPLVLAECMNFGIVPVVYGSYSAVYDIIDNNINGIIVPPEEKKFNILKMVEKLSKIMEDSLLYERMAKNAIDKSTLYSINSIYKMWINLFAQLKGK